MVINGKDVSLERYKRNQSISKKMGRVEKEKIFGKYEIWTYCSMHKCKQIVETLSNCATGKTMQN